MVLESHVASFRENTIFGAVSGEVNMDLGFVLFEVGTKWKF